ncbi:MAG: HisA/HisF-related TIM barrel protein, partial [Methanomassiliicoccales archaeon]|nr:HisA/HisF-related TIM barrel protein [Methanomassiliicoccales archaeon]
VAEEEGFAHIPIVPVDTRPLMSQTGFDLPLIKVVEVVTVEWGPSGFGRTGYAARFDRYWNAISGTRYSSKQILMMDLSGICNGKPNFKAMRDLVRSKYEVWLDLGIASEQDVFDAFSLEAHKALADTSTVPSIRLFEDIYALSDRCVPCVQVAGEVVWGGGGYRLRRLEDALDALERIGFTELAVMDLQALGRKRGVSEELMDRLQGFKPRIYLGGGVVESDLERMQRAGLAGAFVEPFTPIIRDLIDKDEDKVVADAPEEAIVARKAPRYLATD